MREIAASKRRDPNTIELGQIKYRCWDMLPFTSFVSIVSFALYLGYRVKYIVASHLQTEDTYEQLNLLAYFVAELGLFYL